ncbi:MAG: endonuclease domain-containing protein [Hyphomonadaceae bacterium]|nr:endonuclease domain-containing protein [Hyphomonadaceae bacterium]
MANAFARALRKRMTPEEARLWSHLRRWRAKGWHFRRQVPLGDFIVDFACLTQRLVIEVDGLQHREAFHLESDVTRDAALNAMGFRVLRIANADVKRDFSGVIDTILAALEGRR